MVNVANTSGAVNTAHAKVPETIEFITNKFLNDPQLYSQLTILLKMIVSSIYTDSLSHGTFCAQLKTPNGLTPKLLTMYGVSDRQLSSALETIGFYKGHKMYSDLYYQTLIVVYYIGLRKNDDVLRMYALVLIFVKLFNGRKYRYMPNGCQDGIAQHLLSNVLRQTSIFVKYPNPFSAISQYFAPSLDNSYHDQILKEPSNPKRGLLVILAQGWGRMDQVFVGIAQHYYAAWEANGQKPMNSNQDLQNGQDVDNLSNGKVLGMVNKSIKNLMNDYTKLNQNDIQYLKSPPYSVSNMFIDKVQEFLSDSRHEEDLRNIIEVMFGILNIHDEHQLCVMNIVLTADKLSGVKSKADSKHNLKEYVDILLKEMFGNVMLTAGASTQLKLRKVLLLIILLRSKKSLCDAKAGFERAGF